MFEVIRNIREPAIVNGYGLRFSARLTILTILKGVITMKEKIHPAYYDTTITCACGNVIQTRSTVRNIHVEICSNCHPFFTGKQKLIDTAGRVEKFRQRYEKKVENKPKASERAAS